MKKKTVVKIVLDAVMAVVLAILYSKNAISMAFHEIAGLAIIGAFIIHKLLNARWIVSVTKKLRDPKTPARTRFLYALDCALLVLFLVVGVSGIPISKVVFSDGAKSMPSMTAIADGEAGTAAQDETAQPADQPAAPANGGKDGGQIWKILHYTGAALALIAVGIHLGMHFSYLTGIFKRWIRLPGRSGRAVAAVAVAALLAVSFWSLASTGFTRWLTMPFSAGQTGGEGSRRAQYLTEADEGEGATGADAARTDADTSGESGREARVRKGGTGSPLDALKTFIQFFSIAFLFAALTVCVEKLLLRAKGRPARIAGSGGSERG